MNGLESRRRPRHSDSTFGDGFVDDLLIPKGQLAYVQIPRFPFVCRKDGYLTGDEGCMRLVHEGLMCTCVIFDDDIPRKTFLGLVLLAQSKSNRELENVPGDLTL